MSGRRCSDTAAPDMLRKVKPLSTQPILYVSSQMRMLRALKKTGLDFSKVERCVRLPDVNWLIACFFVVNMSTHTIRRRNAVSNYTRGTPAFRHGQHKKFPANLSDFPSLYYTDCLFRVCVCVCVCVFSTCVPQQSFGDGPQKKALSRRFKSYSWIFTDALIDKLVALRVEDAARARAVDVEPAMTDPLAPRREGEQEEDWLAPAEPPRWKELKIERRTFKSDVMREMTAGCGSSKELLVKVIGSWLPDVLAADGAAERRAREASV